MRRRWLAWLLVGVISPAACARAPGATQPCAALAGGQSTPGPPAGAPTLGPAPTQGPETPAPTASSGEIVAVIDGVSVTVCTNPNPVHRGDDVSFVATLRNDRRAAVDYAPGHCAFGSLRATFPIPWHPTGRTWSGREGWFKDFVLNHAYGPGAVAAWAPIVADLMATPCDESSTADDRLEPGEVQIADFGRAMGDALRRHPHAEAVSFSITAQIDRQEDPSGSFPTYTSLTAEGVLAIDGPVTELLTAGEAIDLLLGNEEFATWLNDQPAGGCVSANLELADGPPPDYDYVVWVIQLMCETDGRRHDGVGFVDAETGDIRRVELKQADAETAEDGIERHVAPAQALPM